MSMNKPVVFTPRAVRELTVDMPRNVKDNADRRAATIREAGAPEERKEQQVRIARTVSNDFAYPSGASSKYEIEFGIPTFDKTSLDGEVTFTPYEHNERFRIAGLFEAATYSEGTIVRVMLCHGKWYIVSGVASSALIVEFEIVDAGYDTDPYDDESQCANLPSGPNSDVLAEVLQATTCNLNVPGRDENGYITLVDRTGFFTNRSPAQLEGKNGFAVYLCDGYTRSWVVLWMDWFRKRQTVTDWRKTATQIIVELENHWVWNHCELPDYTLDLQNCPDDEYGGCS